MTISSPEGAKFIAFNLKRNGFQCYIVGGYIRDSLLGKKPKDCDLCTDATPSDIHRIFGDSNTILDIGAVFGITTIMHNGIPYEIAQMRTEEGFTDGRHPDIVKPVRDIEIDLARRDFTINAMAWDPIKETIQDPFAGSVDLQDKVISFVGDACARICEDTLRVLRAFRFMSQLNFELNSDAIKAINSFCVIDTFKGVSQERITAEFEKLLMGKNAFNTLHLMAQIGVLFKIIPELEYLEVPHDNYYHTEEMVPYGNSIFAHTMFVVKAAADIPYTDKNRIFLLLAALFHDIGKPLARGRKPDGTSNYHRHDIIGEDLTRQILTRMKFSNETIGIVCSLVKQHMMLHDLPKMKRVCKIRRLIAKEHFYLLYTLGICDTMGTAGDNGVPNFADAEKLVTITDKYLQNYGSTLPEPIIKGDDLIEAGLKPGRDFTPRLEHTFNLQLDGCVDKQKLLKHAISLTISGEKE